MEMSPRVVFILLMTVSCVCGGAGLIRGISYRKSGDLIIGGLIPVHEYDIKNQRCSKPRDIGSLRRVEALAFAVDKINKDPTILNNFTLGFEIYDTCSSGSETLRNALAFIPDIRKNNDLIGIVGPQRSSSSVQATTLLALYNISLISYLSTSDELSNDIKYPYFLRTVPPDKFQVSVITDMIKKYDWRYVVFLYSDDTYGKSAETEFTMQAEEKGICPAYTQPIPISADIKSYVKIVTKLKELKEDKPLASVVILFMQREIARHFFNQTKHIGIYREFIWIGSDGWGNYGLDPLIGAEENALGALTVIPKSGQLEGFDSYFDNTTNYYNNPWLHEYTVDPVKCKNKTVRDCTLKAYTPLNAYESIVADSVEVLARGLDNMKKEVCQEFPSNKSTCKEALLSNRRLLREYLLNVTFNSPSNGIVEFTEKGDSKGHYSIRNLQKNNDKYEFKDVGNWVESVNDDPLTISNVEWYIAKTTDPDTYNSTLGVPRSVCSDPCKPLQVQLNTIAECGCWTCQTCMENEIIQENICVSCFEKDVYQWPNENRTQCIRLYDIRLADEPGKVVIFVAAALGIAVHLVVSFLYVKHRDTHLIKSSSRELGYIILVGVLLSYVAAMLYATPPAGVVCYLRRIVPNIGISFIYISIGTMSVRLFRIFQASQRTVKRPNFIEPKSQIFITLILSLVPLTWGIVWMIVDKPTVHTIEPTSERQLIEHLCEVSTYHRIGQLIWDAAVVLICCFFAIQTRNLPANYNQTRFIAFSVFSTLIVYIAFAPAFLTSQNSRQQDLYSALGALIQATVILTLLFGVKIYALYFVDEENQHPLSLRPGSSQRRSPVSTKMSYASDMGVPTQHITKPVTKKSTDTYKPALAGNGPDNNDIEYDDVNITG